MGLAQALDILRRLKSSLQGCSSVGAPNDRSFQNIPEKQSVWGVPAHPVSTPASIPAANALLLDYRSWSVFSRKHAMNGHYTYVLITRPPPELHLFSVDLSVYLPYFTCARSLAL